MTDPIKLDPCPFCEGPPVPFVAKFGGGGGEAPLLDEYDDGPDGAGLYVKACVFCHECGAEGPNHYEFLYERADWFKAQAEAVRLWQARDNRHRELFDASSAQELNLYPRKDHPQP